MLWCRGTRSGLERCLLIRFLIASLRERCEGHADREGHYDDAYVDTRQRQADNLSPHAGLRRIACGGVQTTDHELHDADDNEQEAKDPSSSFQAIAGPEGGVDRDRDGCCEKDGEGPALEGDRTPPAGISGQQLDDFVRWQRSPLSA